MRGGRAFLWAVVLVMFISSAEAGQLVLDCLSPLRTLSPPAALSLSFRLTNHGQKSAQVQLAFFLPEGVTLLAAPRAPAVAPGTSEVVLATFFVSSVAPPGTQTIAARAESAAGRAHTEVDVEISPHVEVELILPPGGHGRPGEELQYRLQVSNRGNVREDFFLELSSAWPAEISEPRVRLLPGDSVELSLLHAVPAAASPGEQCRVHVSVRALTSAKPLAEGTLRTQVLPPPPGEVPRALYPVLPATLRWSGSLAGEVFSAEGELEAAGDIGPDQRLALVAVMETSVSSITMRRSRLSYRGPGWSVWGEICCSALGGKWNLVFGHERAAGPHAVSYRWEFPDAALAVRWTTDRLDTELSLDSSGKVSLIASGKAGGGRLEGRLSSEGGAVHLASRAGCSSFSARAKWGTESTLSFRASGKKLSVGAEWVLTGPELRLSWRHRGPLDARATAAIGTTEEGQPALHGLQGVLAGGRRTPWRWSLEAGVRRAGRALPVGGLWAVRAEGGTSIRLATAGVLRLDGEFSLPALPAHLRGARWRAAVGGDLSLGSRLFMETALTLSCSGTEFTASLRAPAGSVSLAVGPGRVEVSLEARARVPVPLMETKGRVEGAVRSELCEQDTSGLVLALGGEQAITGEDGAFRFPPIAPGEYQLELLSIPLGTCVYPDNNPSVVVRAGRVSEVELSLVAPATVSGRVVAFGGARRIGGEVAGADGGIEGAEVVLTDGVRAYRRVTDARGAFEVRALCPGVWELRADMSELVPPHRLEEDAYSVRLSPGQSKEVILRAEPSARSPRPLQTQAP